MISLCPRSTAWFQKCSGREVIEISKATSSAHFRLRRSCSQLLSRAIVGDACRGQCGPEKASKPAKKLPKADLGPAQLRLLSTIALSATDTDLIRVVARGPRVVSD